MTRPILPVLALVAFLQVATVSSAQSTPKECCEKIVACVMKGDIVAASAYFTEPVGSNMKKLGTAMSAFSDSTRKLVAAVDKKFGEGAAKECFIEAMDFAKMMEGDKVEVTDVKEDGDKATVTTKTTHKDDSTDEETLQFARQGDKWFCAPPKDDPKFGEKAMKDVEKQADAMTKLATASDEMTKNVEAGKYETKDDVQKAYGECMSGEDAK